MAKKVAKKYKESPVAEEALFLVAEARFARQRYAWAQDGYDELIKQFPSTRYLDQATRRLFTIAQIWLQSPTAVTVDDIQQVNFEDPSSTPPPPLRLCGADASRSASPPGPSTQRATSSPRRPISALRVAG